ncbi:vacuolar protein sorting-associated protein 4A-like [Haliotis rubra]|uniref:vacuolar protein sorting-associated protein 4A-like n=1 Tax=Haliotis rubra TaxID=36100 RepID=UPI001EE4FA4D|nr:vacuolar protein sorting-associated protein 4A-like [Haliotis rubra]
MASSSCENNVTDTSIIDLSDIVDVTVNDVECRGGAVVEGACGGDAGDGRRSEDDLASHIDGDESGSGDAEQQDKQETPKDNTLRQKIAAAVDILTQAAEREKKSDLPESFRLYKEGIHILHDASKEIEIGKKGNIKALLDTKIRVLLTKAEHLKDKIKGEREAGEAPQSSGVTDEVTQRREYLAGFIQDPNEKVNKSSIVGQEDALNWLMEKLVLPYKFPRLFERYRMPRHLLIFGHPGTGKTMALRACASMIPEVTFFKLSVYDFMTKSAPDEERNVQELFRMASEKKDSVIIIEDFERIYHSDDRLRRIHCELMVQMESQPRETMVVCITQTPWHLQSSLRRRLYMRCYFHLPTKEERINILKAQLEETNHKLTYEDFDKIGNRTTSVGGHRFTQADMVVLSRDIIMQMIRRIQKAEYFRKMTHPVTKIEDYWMPCHHDDEGAVQMNWMDVDAKKLLEPDIEMSDVLLALASTMGTADPDRERNMFEWRSTYTEI